MPSLVLAPLTLLAGPVVSYNVLITLAMATSAWMAYVACRRITGSEAGALVCGLVYGFGPFMQAQSLAHAHMAIAVFPPFALLMVHELAVTQRRPPHRTGILLGLGCVAQLLTGEELLFASVAMAAFLTAVLAAMHRNQVRTRAPHFIRGLATAAAVGVLLRGPFVAFQFLGPRHVTGLLQPKNTYVADIAGFVVPTRLEWLSGSWLHHISDRFTGFSGEFGVYLGVPILVTVAYATWTMRSRTAARAAAYVGAASLVLSLGGRLHVLGHETSVPLPWLPLGHLPVVENVIPDRLAPFTALAVGVLLGLLVQDLSKRPRRARRIGWAGVAAALVSIAPAAPAPTTTLSIPSFFTTDAVRSVPLRSTAIVYPRQTSSFLAMAAQVGSDFRFRLAQGGVFTPDGFGSPTSDIFELLIATEDARAPGGEAAACDEVTRGAIDDKCRDMLSAELRRYAVGVVFVLDAPGADVVADIFSAYYRTAPIRADGVRVWIAPHR